MQITTSCFGRAHFRNGSMPAYRPRKRAHNRHQLLSLTTTESKQKEREKWWPSWPLISKGFLQAFTREVILSAKPSREAVHNKNTSLQWMLCFTPSVFLAESLWQWHLVLVTCLSPLRLQKGVGVQKLKLHQGNKTAIKNNWHLLATASDTRSTAGMGNMGVYYYWIHVEKKKEHDLLSFSLYSTETNALALPS